MSRMRDQVKLQQRSDYVKKIVSQSSSTKVAVKELSESLFISERTIYRDLVR